MKKCQLVSKQLLHLFVFAFLLLIPLLGLLLAWENLHQRRKEDEENDGNKEKQMYCESNVSC